MICSMGYEITIGKVILEDFTKWGINCFKKSHAYISAILIWIVSLGIMGSNNHFLLQVIQKISNIERSAQLVIRLGWWMVIKCFNHT